MTYDEVCCGRIFAMATKKKVTAKRAAKAPKKASAKIVAPVVLDHPDDDFSTNSPKFAFSHSVPEDGEPERLLPVVEQLEEEPIVEEVIEISVGEDAPTGSVHFVVATPNIGPAKSSELTENFTDYGISLELSKSIAEKFGIHYKQIDIILGGSGEEIEISFGRIYLSGEDVARLSIGSR
jgi:hypothetical protein